jgi:hypothetical protein
VCSWSVGDIRSTGLYALTRAASGDIPEHWPTHRLSHLKLIRSLIYSRCVRSRFALPVVTAATLVGLLGCGGSRGATAAFLPCYGPSQIRPASIVVACGDGNFFIRNIKWSSWTQLSAAGTGIGHANDCNPYCAAGHFHRYPVALRLQRPEGCTKRRDLFTRFTVQLVGRKPPKAPRYYTLKIPFYTGRGCP